MAIKLRVIYQSTPQPNSINGFKPTFVHGKPFLRSLEERLNAILVPVRVRVKDRRGSHRQRCQVIRIP